MLSGSALNYELVERYKLWLATLDYSASVQGSYPRLSRGFCESLGEREVIHATPWDVRRFLVHELKRGRKYYAVYELLVVLRSFFDFLDLGGITTEIPLKSVRIRPPQLVPPHVISPRAIQRLVSAAQNSRDAAIVELLYATGCRSSELVGIKFGDIDFESRKIRVTGKNNKVRYVVFGTRAASAVMAYLDGRNSGYLFQSTLLQRGSIYCCSRTRTWIGDVTVFNNSRSRIRSRKVIRLGRKSEMTISEAWVLFKERTRNFNVVRPAKAGPLDRNTIRVILNKLAIRVGIKRISPRTIRHCFATHMLDGGADIREIQELLGHVNLTSTQIYTHVSRKKLLETFDRCHPTGNAYNVDLNSTPT
ncbi:MAG: tyrosine-type recombinase/integrase [Candidatus Acidiferrales bacterium]